MVPPTDKALAFTAPPVASDREDPRVFLKDRAYELLKTMILKESEFEVSNRTKKYLLE